MEKLTFKLLLYKIRQYLKIPVRYLGERGFIYPALWYCRLNTVEFKFDNHSESADKINLFALSAKRFMSDLKLLANSGQFRVFSISEKAQGRILGLYEKDERLC